MEYSTAVHKCCCGCGQEVVTPLSPTDWKLIFDGETVSLSPSIGNWSYKCRSHYFITRNKIQWCSDFSNSQVQKVKDSDALAKQQHYESLEQALGSNPISKLYFKLKKWFTN